MREYQYECNLMEKYEMSKWMLNILLCEKVCIEI